MQYRRLLVKKTSKKLYRRHPSRTRRVGFQKGEVISHAVSANTVRVPHQTVTDMTITAGIADAWMQGLIETASKIVHPR